MGCNERQSIQHQAVAGDEGDTMQPMKPCKHPGCRKLTIDGYCEAHKAERGPWASKNKPKRLRGRKSQERRKRIAERDGYKCQICGRLTSEGIADHIIPLAFGGKDEEDQMQWLCVDCSDAKTKKESKNGKGR